jgi:hypothetical protein
VDTSEFTSSGRTEQFEIDRRRVNAIRDFEDAFERARDDLAFRMGGVLGDAINDAAGDDPNASASAFYSATQSIERVVLEYARGIRLALRALKLALSI